MIVHGTANIAQQMASEAGLYSTTSVTAKYASTSMRDNIHANPIPDLLNSLFMIVLIVGWGLLGHSVPEYLISPPGRFAPCNLVVCYL